MNVVRLRPAGEADRSLLLEWRNDPETRSASLNHDLVSASEHDAWFSRALADPDVLVFIGLVDDEPVGTVRFERDTAIGVAEVSINLSPAHRGRGLARPLLQGAIDTVRADALRTATLVALIRPENVVSQRLFDRVGFTPTGPDEDGVEVYELRPVTPADPS